jgi:hypothetical protein
MHTHQLPVLLLPVLLIMSSGEVRQPRIPSRIEEKQPRTHTKHTK